jgi:tripartite-type tricarboxylate transporter receptor subunit TctC
MIERRSILGAAALAPFAAVPFGARAQAPAWPTQPIRMVVPFAAGGPTDVPARLLSDRLSEALPQRVVVENRTGSGVVIGTDLVSKAALRSGDGFRARRLRGQDPHGAAAQQGHPGQ